jgi:hypothetical protein
VTSGDAVAQMGEHFALELLDCVWFGHCTPKAPTLAGTGLGWEPWGL